jgi:hypothetical protein
MHRKRSAAAKKRWETRRRHIMEKLKVILYRASASINGIPKHGDYEDALIQAYSWDRDFLADIKPKLIDKLIKCVEQYLGYSESDWWFSYEVNYENPHEIGSYDSKLDDRWEFVIERDGKIVYRKMGLLHYL